MQIWFQERAVSSLYLQWALVIERVTQGPVLRACQSLVGIGPVGFPGEENITDVLTELCVQELGGNLASGGAASYT